MRSAYLLTALTALPFAVGCGTVMNVAVPTTAYGNAGPDAPPPAGGKPQVVGPPPRRAYGGLEYDRLAIRACLRDTTAAPLGLLLAATIALDLPASAVGDTLTLPLTTRPPQVPAAPAADTRPAEPVAAPDPGR